MGWSGGSEVARKMIHSIRENVDEIPARRALYRELIESLTDEDWDCINEARDIDEDFDEISEEYDDE